MMISASRGYRGALLVHTQRLQSETPAHRRLLASMLDSRLIGSDSEVLDDGHGIWRLRRVLPPSMRAAYGGDINPASVRCARSTHL